MSFLTFPQKVFLCLLIFVPLTFLTFTHNFPHFSPYLSSYFLKTSFCPSIVFLLLALFFIITFVTFPQKWPHFSINIPHFSSIFCSLFLKISLVLCAQNKPSIYEMLNIRIYELLSRNTTNSDSPVFWGKLLTEIHAARKVMPFPRTASRIQLGWNLNVYTDIDVEVMFRVYIKVKVTVIGMALTQLNWLENGLDENVKI